MCFRGLLRRTRDREYTKNEDHQNSLKSACRKLTHLAAKICSTSNGLHSKSSQQSQTPSQFLEATSRTTRKDIHTLYAGTTKSYISQWLETSPSRSTALRATVDSDQQTNTQRIPSIFLQDTKISNHDPPMYPVRRACKGVPRGAMVPAS